MTVVGAIADRVQAIIPVTWDALINDPRVGDGPLQSAIDLAKSHTIGQVVDPTQEQNYPVIAVDYMAKLATIELCNTAVDHWMNQAVTLSSSGTSESLSYIDRAEKIASLRTSLIQETREKYTQVATLVGFWNNNGRAVPLLSSANINPFHNTPSPEEFPRPYRQTPYS